MDVNTPLGDPMDIQPTPQHHTTPSVKDEPQEQPPVSWLDHEIQLSDDDDSVDLQRDAERQRIHTMIHDGRERDKAVRARLLELDDFKARLEARNKARDANRETMSVRVQSAFDQSATAKEIDPAILARLMAEVTESLSEPVPQVRTVSTQTIVPPSTLPITSPSVHAPEPSGGDVRMLDVPSPAVSEPAGSRSGSVEPSSVTKQRSNLALRSLAKASITTATNIKNSAKAGVSNMMTGVSNMTNPSSRRKRHEEESPTIGKETLKKKSKSNLREGLTDDDDLIYDVRGPSPTPATLSHRPSFINNPVQTVLEEVEPESPGQARNVQWAPSRRRRGSSRGASELPSVRPMQSSQTLYEGSQPNLFSPTASSRRSDPAASRASFGFQPAASNAPGSSFLSPTAASRVPFAGHGLQPAAPNAPVGPFLNPASASRTSLARPVSAASHTSLVRPVSAASNTSLVRPVSAASHTSLVRPVSALSHNSRAETTGTVEGPEAGVEATSDAGSAQKLKTTNSKSGPPKVPSTLVYWSENRQASFSVTALNNDVCEVLTDHYKTTCTKRGSRLKGFMGKTGHTDDSRIDGVCLRCRHKGEAMHCSPETDQGLQIALDTRITCSNCVVDGTPCGTLIRDASDPTGYAICFWPLPSDRRQGVTEGSMAYFLIEGGVKGEGGKRSFASKVKQKIMPTSTRKSERLQKPATRIEEAY